MILEITLFPIVFGETPTHVLFDSSKQAKCEGACDVREFLYSGGINIGWI